MVIGKYLDRLAARSPAPGGGSAAALVGAIGISLLSMVAKYLMRKSPSSRKLSKISKFTDRSRRRLRKLMTEDERAYLRLSKAIKKRDSKNIMNLYKAAARVPLEVCAILQEGIKSCEELSTHCGRSLTSDLAETAILLEAGFLSAKLNVEVNLDGIRDKAYAEKIRKLLSGQSRTILKTKKRILGKAGSRWKIPWLQR